MTAEMDFQAISVTGSSVQEFPLDNFIQRGEIVLSTAIGYEGNPEFFLRMIRDIHFSGAAAIAFSFRDPEFDVPQDAVVLAESLGTPVLQMPWEYRFANFQFSLQEAMNRKERATFEEIQSVLFNFFFESRPLKHATEYLSRMLYCPVKITDISRETSVIAGEALSPEHNLPPDPISHITISIGSTVFGFLSLYDGQNGGSLPPPQLLERYVTYPLSLWFYRKTVEDLAAARLKNDFVWNLAENTFTSEEEMLRQGACLHFLLSRSYSCIAMHFTLKVKKSKSTAESDYWEKARYTTGVEQIVLLEAKQQNQHVMVGSRGPELIVYFENRGDNILQNIFQLIDGVENQLKKDFPFLICYWGISEIFAEKPKSDFSRLYESANFALHYCMNSKEDSRRFTYQKTKKMQIMSLLSNSPDMQQSAKQVLGRLVQADPKTEWLRTLSAYINSNCNASKAARYLHITRQSLLYRLEKISAMTGMSLSSHEDLFVLESLLYVYYSTSQNGSQKAGKAVL